MGKEASRAGESGRSVVVLRWCRASPLGRSCLRYSVLSSAPMVSGAARGAPEERAPSARAARAVPGTGLAASHRGTLVCAQIVGRLSQGLITCVPSRHICPSTYSSIITPEMGEDRHGRGKPKTRQPLQPAVTGWACGVR